MPKCQLGAYGAQSSKSLQFARGAGVSREAGGWEHDAYQWQLRPQQMLTSAGSWASIEQFLSIDVPLSVWLSLVHGAAMSPTAPSTNSAAELAPNPNGPIARRDRDLRETEAGVMCPASPFAVQVSASADAYADRAAPRELEARSALAAPRGLQSEAPFGRHARGVGSRSLADCRGVAAARRVRR